MANFANVPCGIFARRSDRAANPATMCVCFCVCECLTFQSLDLVGCVALRDDLGSIVAIVCAFFFVFRVGLLASRIVFVKPVPHNSYARKTHTYTHTDSNSNKQSIVERNKTCISYGYVCVRMCAFCYEAIKAEGWCLCSAVCLCVEVSVCFILLRSFSQRCVFACMLPRVHTYLYILAHIFTYDVYVNPHISEQQKTTY